MFLILRKKENTRSHPVLTTPHHIPGTPLHSHLHPGPGALCPRVASASSGPRGSVPALAGPGEACPAAPWHLRAHILLVYLVWAQELRYLLLVPRFDGVVCRFRVVEPKL